MPVIGGDLGAMSALGQRFGQAGETFQSTSTTIATNVSDALDQFVEQMRALDGEARGLADEIGAEMARLDGQAAGTEWTGANRDQMDSIVATLDDDIVRIKAAIESFVDEASAVVNGSLTSTMNDLRSNVETSGNKALQVSSNFQTGVEGQRRSFDSVMNGAG